MQKICELSGKYSFMSNTYYCNIKLGNRLYMSAESAYQALRISDSKLGTMFKSLTGVESRRLGSYTTERYAWEDIKQDVLYIITREKFIQNESLKDKLLNTGDAIIEDEFLGDILMRVRTELAEVN